MRNCRLATSFGLLCLLAAPAAPEQAAPTLAKDVQPIFDKACTSCHGHGRKKAKLDLSAGASLRMLVDTPSEEVPEMPRVKPGDPSGSYLWQKLQNTAPKGKGMPRGIFTTKRLPDPELDTIRRWIEAGAPK